MKRSNWRFIHRDRKTHGGEHPAGRTTDPRGVEDVQRKLRFILRHRLRARASVTMTWSEFEELAK